MFDDAPAPEDGEPDDMVAPDVDIAPEPDPEGDMAPLLPELAVDDPAPVPEPEADMPDPEPPLDPLAPEPMLVPEPEADVDEPEPDEPAVEALPPPGTIAGEPDVVESVPVAAGRSVDGAVVVDCAKAGAASVVATRHAAMCFFSMVESPGKMQ
jgi:hypothetical protein